MMHVLLGTAVSLATFALVYTSLSLMVCCGWRLAAVACRRRSGSFIAGALFGLRVLPFLGAAAITLGITVPSFLLLEPHSAEEPLGVAPFALAALCVGLWLLGIARALGSQRNTSRAVSVWLRDAVPVRSAENVTIHQVRENAPALIVAGVRGPKVIASTTTLAALSADELRSAIRHEVAHVRGHDNFKKLLFRLCVFFGMAELEAAWAQAAELAADDEAVENERDALDLAAALIKVSRLAANPTAELATGLFEPPSQSLSMRVERLIAWNPAGPAHESASRYFLPPVILTMLGLLPSYSTVLNQMHAFTEWLVR